MYITLLGLILVLRKELQISIPNSYKRALVSLGLSETVQR